MLRTLSANNLVKYYLGTNYQLKNETDFLTTLHRKIL